jgi:RNA polymerase sigma-70 factor, ECF subfamily
VRLARADNTSVENIGAWLTTIVARVCLNELRSRSQRREDPLDTHRPDP